MVIIIENGPQFLDKIMVKFYNAEGIKLKFTFVHHPRTNKKKEVKNKLILNLRRKKVEGAKEK